jgi:ubiquinone/menaquinone biosynthesis C-methylase UbiE
MDGQHISRHYAVADLGARILDRLRQAGLKLEAITRDDLASFDEFHTGGRESTRQLARLAGLEAGRRVLDVGSGIGGPARTLAAEFGVHVTGIDLTEEFCRAAEMLTSLVGLSDRVTFRTGDALAMPFGDAAFDVVWSQNTIMNIADKARLFAEIRRVLRPGGVFALEAVLAGPGGPIHVPTFWASSPDMSFLVPDGEARALLAAAGFREMVWEDVTASALDRARARGAPGAEPAAAALGRDVIVADRVAEKIANAVRNNEEGRTRSIRAVLATARVIHGAF